MIAKILVDNNAQDGLSPEWGLAVSIEHEGHHFLLDTGASGLFAQNAESMGIDLETVEFGVLSHAHYDHADGLDTFFEKNKTAPFYLKKEAADACYSRKKWFPRYIGIKKGVLKAYRERIVYVDGDKTLCPGVTIVPHKTPGLHKIGRKIGMYVRKGLRWHYDAFAHEQSLVVETKQGLVVFNSCSHGGADTIIREVRETFPGKEICAYVGGLHLYRSSDEEVRLVAEKIRETGIEHIYTGHCTGDRAFAILQEELGGRMHPLYTGLNISV